MGFYWKEKKLLETEKFQWYMIGRERRKAERRKGNL